jgi:tetratricopeptide (TPR) repeat protein
MARRLPDDEFMKIHEQMIRQGVDTPDILLNLAISYTNAKRYKDAEELLVRATKKDPKHDPCWYQLGCVQYYQGKFREAIIALKKASALKANDYHSAHYIGLCLFELGKRDEGIQLIEGVTRVAPSFVYAWRSLGMIYQKVSRHDDSEFAYMRAIALEPDEEETFNTLKALVERSGRELVKIIADGEGVLMINEKSADGKPNPQKIMTIPKKMPPPSASWELKSVTTMQPDGKGNPYTTHTGEDIPESLIDMPFGPVTVMCPKCKAVFIPTRKFVRPGGRILCHKCSHLFLKPLKM